MADAEILGDLAQAELLRGRVGEAFEGGPQEPRLQPLLARPVPIRSSLSSPG